MRYNWQDGQLVFCRNEQEETPHDLDSQDSHHVVCRSCKRRTSGVTLVVNFSTDERSPPSIMFPRREK